MNEQKGIGMTSARTRERLIERLKSEGITNAAVLDRIRSVPRHLFVDEALASRAYEDTALPIGFGQTISQPYVVALMTEALIAGGKKLTKVLEIGTGCGYQTAVLAPFVQHVYSVGKLRHIDDPKRAAGIPNSNFPHAPPNRVHRLPIVGFKATLDLVELVSGFRPGRLRKIPEIIKGVAPECDGFQIGHGRDHTKFCMMRQAVRPSHVSDTPFPQACGRHRSGLN